MQEHYGERVRVVAVNAYNEERRVIEDFVKDHKLPYTVLLQGERVFKGPYRGRAIPHNYIIDAGGTIRYARLGFDEDMLQDMTEVLDKLLEKQTASIR